MPRAKSCSISLTNDTWFPPTDGTGRTLVVRDAAPSHSGYGSSSHWAISGSATGSPGTADADFAAHYHGWSLDKFTAAEMKLPDGSDNLALVGSDANLDYDALNNLGEYAFGRDPKTPEGDALVTADSVTIGPDSFATVTFRRRHKALDLTYDIQFSSDLSAWDSTTEQVGTTTDLGNGMEQVTFRDTTPMGATRRFTRVTATEF